MEIHIIKQDIQMYLLYFFNTQPSELTTWDIQGQKKTIFIRDLWKVTMMEQSRQ